MAFVSVIGGGFRVGRGCGVRRPRICAPGMKEGKTEKEPVKTEGNSWRREPFLWRRGTVSSAEKTKGNGTHRTDKVLRDDRPAKSMGMAWTGLAVGTAAQLLPFFPRNDNSDALYFFLVATGALYAGSKRNATEVAVDDLKSTQALLAPFTAGGFLVGCYLLLRYTTVDIGLIFQTFTSILGTVCLKETLDPIFYQLLTTLGLQPQSKAIGEDGCEDDEESWYSLKNISTSLISIACVGSYALHREPSFFFSNVISFGIAVRCISLLKAKTVLSASALLVGLLLYDIFFVFGTNVMVSVATQIEAPAKFLFPRGASSKYPYAILGLGDVVIPGIFASLMVFVDKELVFGDEREVSHVANGPYFTSAVVSYVLGLLTCFVANSVTRAPQPALLYLVPALLGGTAFTAVRRGEWASVLNFNRSSQQSLTERRKLDNAQDQGSDVKP